MTTDPLPSIASTPLLALLLATSLAALACEQPPPPSSLAEDETEDEVETETETETESESGDGDDSVDTSGENDDQDTTAADTGEGDGSLYPLVEGARWTYVVTNTYGQVIGHKILETHETVWQGELAWELVEEPDPQGKWDTSTIVRDGDLVLRVHRQEHGNFGVTGIFDYDPGFLRVNEAWNTVGFKQELSYDRIAYDGGGQNPMIEARAHTYEVMAVDEPITVAAGTFNCVKIERVRTLGAEAGALAWFWFAPGIGKIREERPIEMEIEELWSVQIPGGATYP